MYSRRRSSPTPGGLLLAVLALIAVALSGCTSDDAEQAAASSSAAASKAAAPPSVAWKDCTDQIAAIVTGQPGADRKFTFSCGTQDVPISYADPAGGTVQLFLVRAVLQGQQKRIGSLLVNPGGPGSSATDAAIQSALTLPEDVVSRFDIVGVDPRGVGLSSPVECISDQTKDQVIAADPRDTDQTSLTAAFDSADAVAKGCSDKYGAGLGAFDTVDSARDLDRVRQALGDERLTYLGYSYGTTLGSTYAQLFPDKVRALVLDGAVDPDADVQDSAKASAKAFEAAFDDFAAACTDLAGGCAIGKDPREFVGDLLDRAGKEPIPSSKDGETRQATPGLILAGIRAALYQPDAWPQLTQALESADDGDAAGVLTLADTYTGRNDDGSYSNVIDANLAVSCADTTETVDRDTAGRLAVDWNSHYPLFGADAAISLYSCTPWQAQRTALPHGDAAGAAPVLVIGTQGDPVTPLAGAQDMAKELSSGVLLTWQGSGHTAYPKTSCVTKKVDAYLVDGDAPKDGTTCPVG